MNICRVCESKEIYANLIEDAHIMILNKLKAIADIQFDPNDCLPKHICEKCISNLEIAYKFKIQCEYTEQKLRRLLQIGDSNKIRNHVLKKKLKNKAKINEELKKNASNNAEEGTLNDEQDNFFKIEVLDEISEEHIEATDPIEIVNVFECKENQNAAQDDEICHEPQETHEYFPLLTIENSDDSLPTEEKTKNEPNEKTISKVTQYKCDTCNEVFDFLYKFNIHKKTHGNQRYQCPDCGKWFQRQFRMRLHKTVHDDEKKVSCELCGRLYKSLFSLDRHVREFHNKERNYSCDKCDKCFAQASSLKTHLLTHTEDRPFECDICGKWYKSQHHLKYHKRSHLQSHEVNKYSTKKSNRKHTSGIVCEICGKISYSFVYHKMHLRVHTGEKPYECYLCKKRFAFVQPLRKHMRIHTGERPYTCDVCHSTFAQLSHLRSHQLVHSGARPHKCLVCLKSFSHRPTLTVHMRIHTGERPYHCTQCPKQFIDLNGLKRHKLLHTKNSVD